MNVTKIELCSRIGKKFNRPSSEVKPIVEALLEEIITALSNDNRIEIRGFGCFSTKIRRQRTGRNPRTGEEVSIPEYKAPTFKFSRDAQKMFDSKIGQESKISQKETPKKEPKKDIPKEAPVYSNKPELKKSEGANTVASAENFAP